MPKSDFRRLLHRVQRTLRLKRVAIPAIVALCAVTTGLVVTAGAVSSPPQSTSTVVIPGVTDPIEARFTKPVVYWIGDSYTEGSGMGGNDEKNYSAIVSDHYGWNGFNKGIGGTGYLAEGGVGGLNFGSPSRVNQIGTNARPSLIFIVDGVNDLNKPLDEVRAAVDATFKSYIHASQNGELIVVGYIVPGPASDVFLEANAMLREIADANGLTFWDPAEEDWLKGRLDLIGEDNFHLNDAGHEYLAQKFIEHIDEAGLAAQATATLDSYYE